MESGKVKLTSMQHTELIIECKKDGSKGNRSIKQTFGGFPGGYVPNTTQIFFCFTPDNARLAVSPGFRALG